MLLEMKTPKTIYTLLFLLPVFGIAQSQKMPLTGKVTDGETHQPIHAATVELLRTDSSIAAEVISQQDGTFTFKNPPAGPTTVRITVIGYKSFSKNLKGGVRADMGIIPLSRYVHDEQTVVVVGTRAAFKTEIDKKIFNVDKSLASKGGTAQD